MRAKAMPNGSAWAAAGAAALLAGCSTLLGFEELSPIAEDASTPSQDAGSEQTDSELPGQDASAETVVPEPDAASDSSVQDVVSEDCGDTQSSPRNCGSCGHDCLAGECKEGKCQPALLVGGLTKPTDLVVHGDSILFTESVEQGRIYSVPKKGGQKAEFVKSALFPCALVHDATTLFWTNCADGEGDVMRCSLVDCSGQKSLATTNFAPGLIETADHLFWTEQSAGKLKSVSLDGGTVKELFSTFDGAPHRLVERDGYIYFTSIEYWDVGVFRVKADGASGVEPIRTGTHAWGIASGGDSIYWSSEGLADGMIWRWAVGSAPDAGAEKPLATAVKDPYDVAADDKNVYWVTTGGDTSQPVGEVFSCPLTGCSKPTLIASGQSQPWRIIADAAGVYWLNRGLSGTTQYDGALMMIAK